MAASASDSANVDNIALLLPHKGRRENNRSNSSNDGGWRAAYFIIGAEFAERLAFYGVSANLITYLTGPLRQSTASAAANVNAFAGSAHMLPLLGAFVADSYLGSYTTILYSSLLYILGLGLLTLSVILTTSSPVDYGNDIETNTTYHTSLAQLIIFFTALCLLVIAVSGHKPCLQAFGADQFEGRSGSEASKSKSSFFNWWYCGLNAGTVLSYLTMSYIQENLSWALGIGVIPCISMIIAVVAFVLGTKTYSNSTVKQNGPNPFVRITKVFVAAARNWRLMSTSSIIVNEDDIIETSSRVASTSTLFKFPDKALMVPTSSDDQGAGSTKETSGLTCSRSEVEEAKRVLRLAPIWCTCLTYAIAYAQCSTFFTKQGSTMDRTIFRSNIQIPAASLQAFTTLSIALCMPIYDCIFVPITRVFTGRSSGVTTLQRVGCGMVLSVISMIVAAVIEKRRLEIASSTTGELVQMSVWWLLPQYILMGVSRAFTMVGLQEFFYDQVPDGMRNVGIALYMSVFGVGSFLSGFLIYIIEKATGASGRKSWLPNNLNEGHLHYFYWFLVGLSSMEMIAYLYFAKSYNYN